MSKEKEIYPWNCSKELRNEVVTFKKKKKKIEKPL